MDILIIQPPLDVAHRLPRRHHPVSSAFAKVVSLFPRVLIIRNGDDLTLSCDSWFPFYQTTRTSIRTISSNPKPEPEYTVP